VRANSRDAHVKITINIIPKLVNQYADCIAHAHTHTRVYVLRTSLQGAWHTGESLVRHPSLKTFCYFELQLPIA